MINLIALGYKSGVGKDTLADYLCAAHGYTRIPFALSLKNAAREVFDFSDEQLHGSRKNEVDPRWGFSPREALQRMGTEAMRGTFGPDVWVRAWERRVAKAVAEGRTNIVVTDVRFLSEVEAVVKLGGFLVRIERPGAGAPPLTERYFFGLLSRKVQHASETELAGFSGWNWVVYNNGDLTQLRYEGDRLLRVIAATKAAQVGGEYAAEAAMQAGGVQP